MAPGLLPVTAPTAPNKTHLAQPSKRGLAARFVRWLTTVNNAKSIRVSEYLTALPPLPMLRERLHQAMEHAREQAARRLPDAEGRS